MTTETIILRHTLSKVPHTYNADYARDLLADPHLGQFLEEVRTEKTEVLGLPSQRVDGKRKVLKDIAEPSEEHVDQIDGTTAALAALSDDDTVPTPKDKD